MYLNDVDTPGSDCSVRVGVSRLAKAAKTISSATTGGDGGCPFQTVAFKAGRSFLHDAVPVWEGARFDPDVVVMSHFRWLVRGAKLASVRTRIACADGMLHK